MNGVTRGAERDLVSAAKSTGVRVLVAGISLASLAGVAAVVPRFWRLGQGLGFPELLFALALDVTNAAALGGCLLAVALVVKSWEQPGARALAVFLAAAATSWGVLLRLGDYQITVEGITVSASGGAAADATTSGASSGMVELVLLLGSLMIVAASFLRFAAAFPRKLRPTDLTTAGPVISSRAGRLLLNGRAVWILGLTWPLVIAAVGVVSVLVSAENAVEGVAAVPLLLTFLAFPLAAMMAGTRFMAINYGLASAEDRRRLLWMVVGMTVSTWMIILPILLWPILWPVDPNLIGKWTPVLWAIAPGILVSAIAFAMFYTGGIDPSLVLSRSMMIGLLSTVGIVVYAALESYASDWLRSTTGLPDVVISILLGLGAAGVAWPLRRMKVPFRNAVAELRER